MHLGGLRTALFNYLAAKKSGGQFLLRIEDTDQSRTVPGAVEGIKDVLKWTNILPDPNEPILIQSRRLKIYRDYAEVLISERKAYRCFCSKERLDALKQQGRTGYDGACRNLDEAYKISDRPHVIRLRSSQSNSATTFHDQVFGHIRIPNLGHESDVILVKSDGYPTYHFANVIDDHESGINLVMRGQEWLPSTPLHVLLYDILGWDRPAFAHLPLLVRQDGSKLSKRQGDAFVEHYRQMGYLPEALCNFVAFLGWSPSGISKEVMGLNELVEAFSIDAVNKAESRVDINKLNWLNRKHLGLVNLTQSGRLVSELKRKLINEHQDLLSTAYDSKVCSEEYLQSVIELIKDRIYTLSDIPRLCPYFFTRPAAVLNHSSTEHVAAFRAILSSSALFTKESISASLSQLKERFPMVKPSELLASLRMAITGTKVGASLVDTMHLLGETEVMQRLESACNSINKE